VVGGIGDNRKIGQKIVEQDLFGALNGRKRQEEARPAI